MKSVSVKRLREELPEILKKVEAGEEFLIIYHSKPVGEIIPLKKRKRQYPTASLYDFLEEPFGEISLDRGQRASDLVRMDRE